MTKIEELEKQIVELKLQLSRTVCAKCFGTGIVIKKDMYSYATEPCPHGCQPPYMAVLKKMSDAEDAKENKDGGTA